MELLDDYKQEDAQLLALEQKLREATVTWWLLIFLQHGLLVLYGLFKFLFYAAEVRNPENTLAWLGWTTGWLILIFLVRVFWAWYRMLLIQSKLYSLQNNEPSPLANLANDWLYLASYLAVHFFYKYHHFYYAQDYILDLRNQSAEWAMVFEQDFDHMVQYLAFVSLGCAVGYNLIKHQSRFWAHSDKWAAISQLGRVASAKLLIGFGFLLLLFYTRLSADRYDAGSFIPPPTFEQILEVYAQSILAVFFFCNALPLLLLYYYLDWKQAQEQE